jgi:ATP-dependent helicase/nuclease subunit B
MTQTISLDEALDAGTLILAPSARVRRRLTQYHCDQQLVRGATSWRRAPIETMDSWLRRQFTRLIDDGHETRTLLNASQAMLIWHQAIAASPEANTLLRLRESAAGAMGAARLMADWHIGAQRIADYAGPEAQAFISWRKQVIDIMRRAGFLSADHLSRRIREALVENQLPPPSAVAVVQTQNPTRSLSVLIEGLRERGATIFELTSTVHHVTMAHAEGAGPVEEVSLAADWCASHLRDNPAGRLGIVANNLHDVTSRLRHALHIALPLDDQADAQSPTFEIKETQPLGQFAVVHSALQALRLTFGPLSLEECSSFLRSPFVAGANEEFAARCELDIRLRRSGRRRISMERIRRFASDVTQPRTHCPILSEVLGLASEERESARATQPVQEWALVFGRLLKALGWPGDPLTDALAHRTWQRFVELLPELGQLGPLAGLLSARDALGMAQVLANEATMETSESGDPSVYVIGAAEAPHMQFDALWILTTTDDVWPAYPTPNPFIPVQVQREAGVPGIDAASVLTDTRASIAALLGSCSHVTTSWPCSDGIQRLRRSPLFPHDASADMVTGELETQTDPWRDAVAAVSLETVADSHGPTIAAGEGAPGGTGFIAAQSECPFKAFATYRLGARALDRPTDGIDPRVAGNLVHETLQALWTNLGGSERLQSLDEATQNTLIDQSVEQAMTVLAKADPETSGTALERVERRRIARLVHGWLDAERKRQAPFTVLDMERETTVMLGPLALKVRADRVDELEDGSLVILDYKTAQSVNAKGWDETRIVEPQVPIYAVTRTQPVAAAAIAHLLTGKWAFKGAAAHGDVLPMTMPKGDDVPPWDKRLKLWREALEDLAYSAAAGDARVDPRTDSSCQFCHLTESCRIAELQPEWALDESADNRDQGAHE